MIHPIFQNKIRTFQYIGVWSLFALLQAVAFNWLTPLPFWVLLSDSFIHAAIFAVLCLLIWSVVKFGNFEALMFYQRLINHLALALLMLSIYIGIGYEIFSLIFGEPYTSLLAPFIPVKALIGMLIYLPFVQYLRVSQSEPTIEDLISEDAGSEEEIPSKAEEVREILERIAVKSGSKIHVVLTSDICYLQADGDYVQIYTLQGKYLKEQTMKYFEEHLPEKQFVRVHRSYIVNVEMISRIELYEKQSQQLTLKNGQHIKTSPNGYKALRAALNL